MSTILQPRQITPNDYATLCAYWEARKFPVVPVKALPKNGLIVDGYCFGFLYTTETNICWVEWLCSNPATDSHLRNAAMDVLIDALIAHAKHLGFELIFTSSSDERLINRLCSHGFQVGDKNVTQLIKGI